MLPAGNYNRLLPFSREATICLPLYSGNQRLVFRAQKAEPNIGLDVVTPVFWSDNYITLFPGEKKTLHCSFEAERLSQPATALKISGWNIKEQYINIK